MYTKDELAKIQAALGALDYDVLSAQDVLAVLRDGESSIADARTALAHAMMLLHGATDWNDLVDAGALPPAKKQ